MHQRFIKNYVRFMVVGNGLKTRVKSSLSDNRGEITVSTIIWVIIVVVVLLVIVYGFVSGWISDLLEVMRDTTDEKLEPVIN